MKTKKKSWDKFDVYNVKVSGTGHSFPRFFREGVCSSRAGDRGYRLFIAICFLALSACRERDPRSFESAVNVIIP
jgi:hypothetical protein